TDPLVDSVPPVVITTKRPLALSFETWLDGRSLMTGETACRETVSQTRRPPCSRVRNRFLSDENELLAGMGGLKLPARSQTRTVPSAQAVAMRCPSGLKTAWVTRPLCLRMASGMAG